MHDIRAIRDNPEAFVAGWSSRGVDDALYLLGLPTRTLQSMPEAFVDGMKARAVVKQLVRQQQRTRQLQRDAGNREPRSACPPEQESAVRPEQR